MLILTKKEKKDLVEKLCYLYDSHLKSGECFSSSKKDEEIYDYCYRYFYKYIVNSHELILLLEDRFEIKSICSVCNIECNVCENYKMKYKNHNHGKQCVIYPMIRNVYSHHMKCIHLPESLKSINSKNLYSVDSMNDIYVMQNLSIFNCNDIDSLITNGFSHSDCIFCSKCKYCSQGIPCKN